MKKNRILAVLLSMCMAMTLLAACSGGSDETTAAATDAPRKLPAARRRLREL